MKIFDQGMITQREITAAGYLRAPAHIAKTGVQYYAPDELDAEELPDELKQHKTAIKILRPDREVFDPESLASFSAIPVTLNHPPDKMLNAENAVKHQVGFSRDRVERSGDHVSADLVIMDDGAIRTVQAGVSELSIGYTTDILWQAGHDERFGDYDGIQTKIRGNHIAIVNRGRAGSSVRLADKKRKDQTMDGKKRTLDGITFDLSDQGAEVFDKLVGDLEKANATIDTVTKDFEAKLADSAKQIEKLEGERDAAAAKVVTDADLDNLVAERAAFTDKARKLCPEIEVEGKGVEEIKRAVVAIRFVDKGIDLEDKSDEYVGALYDSLEAPAASSVKNIADAIKPKAGEVTDTADAARDRMLERNKNAWKAAK